MGRYRLVVGERGNDQGYLVACKARTLVGAQRALKAALAAHGYDSWGRVECHRAPELGEAGWERV